MISSIDSIGDVFEGVICIGDGLFASAIGDTIVDVGTSMNGEIKYYIY